MFLCRGRYLIQHSFVCSSVAVVVVAVAIFVVGNAVDAVNATADVIVAAAGIVDAANAVAFLLLMRILLLLFSVTFICIDQFCFVFSPQNCIQDLQSIITDIQFHFLLLFSDGDKREVHFSTWLLRFLGLLVDLEPKDFFA